MKLDTVAVSRTLKIVEIPAADISINEKTNLVTFPIAMLRSISNQ